MGKTRFNVLLTLIAVVFTSFVAAVLFAVVPLHFSKADEPENHLPNYHVLGYYNGHSVQLRAFDINNPNEYLYEYCEVLEYFFNSGVLEWNAGNAPSSCLQNKLAVFDCVLCNQMVVCKISGEHNFNGSPIVVSGFTIEHCRICNRDVCTNFYKAANPVGNWSSDTFLNNNEPKPNEQLPFDFGEWIKNTGDNISAWLGDNVGLYITGGTVLIIGAIMIFLAVRHRRR